MKKALQRLLSLLLAFSMLISLAPAVFATDIAEETEAIAVADATEETEVVVETTEATEETTKATEEATEATEETTEVTEEATEATEETTEPTEDVVVEGELSDEALLAAAPTGANMTAAGMKIISKTVNNVAPGVTYDKLIIRNGSNQQNMGILTKVDLTKSVELKASYNGYYTAGSTAANRAAAAKNLKWGFQSTTGQAAAYGSIADAEGTVVMATNADYFNMGTGEPSGYLIMEGNVIRAKNEPYFAILKDGTAVIRDAGTDYSDVVEAISGPFYLVKDGVSVAPADYGQMPRNSIGITADGSVVFFQNDGRQAPKSVGMTLPEMAAVLLDAGCVTALYMDGGGSATVAARNEGAAALEVINSPSDGQERDVSSAVLIVSTAKATGEFDHAAITPNDELYTPKSQIQFAATGVDSAGTPVEIPADVTWALAADSAEMGTIDANGLFTANEKTGVVTVEMRQDGKCVGSAFVEIVSPDAIYFENDEISLGFEEVTDFKMVVRYQERDVHYKVGDIIWSMTNEKMGTFDGNFFTASDGESLNGNVTATSAFNSEVSGTIKVIVGMLPTIVWNFEDVVNEDGTVTDAANYYIKENGGILSTGNYSRGGKQSIEIVSIDDGEPVRFGEKSMKLNYDFTQCGEITEGAIIGTSESFTIPGTPTGIGVWVYAPEGVGVDWERDESGATTKAGFWLRGYIKDSSTGGAVPYDFTLEPKAISEEMAAAGIQPGIDWEGWKYCEASLTHLQAPYTILAGNTFRLMYVAGTKMGTKTANSIYFDNLQFVYGTNVDDIDEPKVDSITIANKELEDGSELTTSKISLRTTFSDVQNKYTSGVDASTIRMYIDGVNVVDNDHYNYALNANDGYAELYDLELLDGQHSVTVSLRDKFGNETKETRFFTVKTGSAAPAVTIVPADDSAVLSDTMDLEVRATQAGIKKMENTIRMSNRFPAPVVTFAEAYTGTCSYNKTTNILTISAELKADAPATTADEGTLIATISVDVPADLTENDEFLFEIKSGSYTTADDKFFTYSAGEEKLDVSAEIAVSCDPILVGGPKGILKVTDNEGKPVAGATFHLVADNTQIGVADENGQWETDYFSAAAGTTAVYAKNADGKPSFHYNVFAYDGIGAADVAPTKIQFNAVSGKNQKNISWMSNPLTEGAQSIRYRAKGTEEWTVKEAKSKLQTFTTGGNTAANINSIILTGLVAGTTYEYQVGAGELWSEVATMSTVAASSSTKFFVISDIQGGDLDNVKSLVADINKGGYQFGVQTGDSIDNVTNYSQVATAVDLLGKDILGDMDMVRVLGNHEFYGDPNGNLVSALYNVPNTAAGSGYSVTYGDVYVATIHFTNSDAELKEALEWLVKDAKASKATWKVLAMHQPPYYTNSVGGNKPINALVPAACEEAGINVVFSGHDHALARTNQLTNAQVDKENGVLYYIGGSCGEKSYPISSQGEFDFNTIFAFEPSVDFNAIYIGVEANALKMTLNIYDVAVDGIATVRDSYTLMTETGDCDAAGHQLDEAVYDRGTKQVICNNCGMAVNAIAVDYTDWASDKETGRKMYLMAGIPQTGEFIFGEDTYYFDAEGVALQGKVTLNEVELEFENGKIVGGYTGFVTKKDGKLYHYVDGAMTHGWLEADGAWYYMSQKTGAALVGKEIIPDDSEALFRNTRYDFAEDGKLVGAYFGRHGYYYWAGEPVIKAFVKHAGDSDPNAWYGTNEIGHFVTDGSENPTVKYTMDGVVYTFDNTNGKLLKGGFTQVDGLLYYYWAGEAADDGWFEVDGRKYYAYEDGHLATGSHVIDGEAYMFNSNGALVSEGVIMTAIVNKEGTKMTVKVSNTEKVYAMRLAVWSADAGQAESLKWFEAEKDKDGDWVAEIPMCNYDRDGQFQIHAYATADGRETLLVNTTTEVTTIVTHKYVDGICSICGHENEAEKPEEPAVETVKMYRMYNPYTQEHLLTSSVIEKDSLLDAGWTLDGIAWSAPAEEGDLVYRLYNPYDDWHTYSTSQEEIDMLTGLGWLVDGVACYSANAENGKPIYRLFNPYEKKNYHMLTASSDEVEFLTGLGWTVDGVAWLAMGE